jgi:hypothetical protein
VLHYSEYKKEPQPKQHFNIYHQCYMFQFNEQLSGTTLQTLKKTSIHLQRALWV